MVRLFRNTALLALLFLVWSAVYNIVTQFVLPLKVVYAQNFGVVCDGATDTTDAVQAAIDAARIGTKGIPLEMPRGGQCIITDTLVVENVRHLLFNGNMVEFVWHGPATSPMWLLQDTRESVFEHFYINASAPNQMMTNAIQIQNGTDGLVLSTSNSFRNVVIECTNGGCEYGIAILPGPGGDHNNEFHSFMKVGVANYTKSAALIGHSQSKNNLFQDFGFGPNDLGQHGIEVNPRGSYNCIRCRGGNTLGAAFYHASCGDVITIDQGNFEGSRRLFETAGPSGAGCSVTISNTRFAINKLAPDGKMIIFQYRGPLNLFNVATDAAQWGSTTVGTATQIWFNPGGGVGSLVAIGNGFQSTLQTPFMGYNVPLKPNGTISLVNLVNMIDRHDG